jgi:hypothetical protein
LDGLYYLEGVAMTITLTREEAQQVFHALKSCSGVPHWPALIPVIETLRARLAQPKQEWQGLTDEEIAWLWSLAVEATLENMPRHFARMVEEKLKEKNHAI